MSGLASSTLLKQAGQEKRTGPVAAGRCRGHRAHAVLGLPAAQQNAPWVRAGFSDPGVKRGRRQVWGSGGAGLPPCRPAEPRGKTLQKRRYRPRNRLSEATCWHLHREPEPLLYDAPVSAPRWAHWGRGGSKAGTAPRPHPGPNVSCRCPQSQIPPLSPPLSYGESQGAGPKSPNGEGWAASPSWDSVKRLNPHGGASCGSATPGTGEETQPHSSTTRPPSHLRPGEAAEPRLLLPTLREMLTPYGQAPPKARHTQTAQHRWFNQQPATGAMSHTSMRYFR